MANFDVMIRIWKLLVVGLLLFSGCEPCKPDLPSPKFHEQFLFLSHTYIPDPNQNLIDSTVMRIDFDRFDKVMLGGDLFRSTTTDTATFLRADSIFDFRSNKSFWAIGNHDYDHPDMVRNYLGHELFFSRYHNGITFLVLDTQDSACSMVNDQLNLIQNVTDTLQTSTCLMVLCHKLIFMPGDPLLEPMIDSICNGDFGTCSWCTSPNNYYQDVYPKLVQVRQRGIKVLVVAGDVGNKVKHFEYRSPEGIQYIASGMNSAASNNEVLRMEYSSSDGVPTWNFFPLNALPQH